MYYFQAAKDKEQEVLLLKTRLERAQEDQTQLRSENVELYKRLRILRANSRCSDSNSNKRDRKFLSATPSKARSTILYYTSIIYTISIEIILFLYENLFLL